MQLMMLVQLQLRRVDVVCCVTLIWLETPFEQEMCTLKLNDNLNTKQKCQS